MLLGVVAAVYACDSGRYSADHKFVQNIDQHLLESITTSQKKTVYSMKDLTP